MLLRNTPIGGIFSERIYPHRGYFFREITHRTAHNFQKIPPQGVFFSSIAGEIPHKIPPQGVFFSPTLLLLCGFYEAPAAECVHNARTMMCPHNARTLLRSSSRRSVGDIRTYISYRTTYKLSPKGLSVGYRTTMLRRTISYCAPTTQVLLIGGRRPYYVGQYVRIYVRDVAPTTQVLLTQGRTISYANCSLLPISPPYVVGCRFYYVKSLLGIVRRSIVVRYPTLSPQGLSIRTYIRTYYRCMSYEHYARTTTHTTQQHTPQEHFSRRMEEKNTPYGGILWALCGHFQEKNTPYGVIQLRKNTPYAGYFVIYFTLTTCCCSKECILQLQIICRSSVV